MASICLHMTPLFLRRLNPGPLPVPAQIRAHPSMELELSHPQGHSQALQHGEGAVNTSLSCTSDSIFKQQKYVKPEQRKTVTKSQSVPVPGFSLGAIPRFLASLESWDAEAVSHPCVLCDTFPVLSTSSACPTLPVCPTPPAQPVPQPRPSLSHIPSLSHTPSCPKATSGAPPGPALPAHPTGVQMWRGLSGMGAHGNHSSGSERFHGLIFLLNSH